MSFFIISPELYAWVILPLLIFFARICDVSMETIRVIYISRGIKYLAPIIAFFEIVIWLLAMEVVMQDLSNIANFMAFALGFAMGTYVGLVIEERLSIGMVILRIITTEESEEQIIVVPCSGELRRHAPGCTGLAGEREDDPLAGQPDRCPADHGLYPDGQPRCILLDRGCAVRERGGVPPRKGRASGMFSAVLHKKRSKFSAL